MYEAMTFDVIMNQMLERVPDTIDKREGSIIYDALAPVCAELAQAYIALDVILNETFADTSTGEYLDRRCAERGLLREQATGAIVQGEFTPLNINVADKRFRCGDYTYVAKADNTLICEQSGKAANNVVGQLIPIEYIEGLESAKITALLIPGEDTEDDESLRSRYFENFNSQAFGGNIADYEEKTKSIDGVGGVKVTPVWNGGGTVLLTIISTDYKTPSDALILTTQTQMETIAPIGHVVTVKGVVWQNINISADISYQDGWDWDSSKTYILSAIDSYFSELAKEWENSDNLIVRISAVEQKILECQCVIDIQNTTLNGGSSNLTLDFDKIPVRGDVVG